MFDGSNLDRAKLVKIFDWSNKRQADWHPTRDFIVTSAHRKIRRHLMNSTGGLVVCTAPTGLGKTATRAWLTLHLGKGRVISVEWKGLDHILDLVGGFRKKIKYVEREVARTKQIPLTEEEKGARKFMLPNSTDTKTVKYTETVSDPYTFWDEDPQWVFIEFKDYSMTHRTAANRDIDDLQLLLDILAWPVETGKEDNRNPYGRDLKTNICVFYQEEQWETLKHHFQNKPQVYRLEPIASDKLVEMYHRLWGWPHLYTDDALFEMAELSRGNPRFFMKYISQTCDNQLDKEEEGGVMETLSVNDIHDILKPGDLVREWAIMFTAVFPGSDTNAVIAEKIIRDLVRDGATMQPAFRKRYFIEGGANAAQNCSYVLGKMEDAGCIRRTVTKLPGSPKRVEFVARR